MRSSRACSPGRARRRPPDNARIPLTSFNEKDIYRHWETYGGRSIFTGRKNYLIISPGKRNSGGGPDYLHAIIRFPDGTRRTGDVEIHKTTAGWYQHRHGTDSQYGNVILHVTAGGNQGAVGLANGGTAPTVLLPPPVLQPGRRPCHPVTPAVSPGRLAKFMRLLAEQRWYRRLNPYLTLDKGGLLWLLAERSGPGQIREVLLKSWLEAASSARAPRQFIKSTLAALEFRSSPVITSDRAGRINLLSALAWRLLRDELNTVDEFEKLRRLTVELTALDLAVPSRPYLIEIAGNWLLPALEAVTGVSRLAEWHDLPRGWYYSRVRLLVARLGLSPPAGFGQQQALLEWDES
ncbi:MAG: DUF2851 family protein, partial [Candidatus Marinimicrobia bacterium]|nr:DUF2851 family protein [Candidatus Neomarinimicrobiota bacterium]